MERKLSLQRERLRILSLGEVTKIDGGTSTPIKVTKKIVSYFYRRCKGPEIRIPYRPPFQVSTRENTCLRGPASCLPNP